jgi:hypothetical protein
MIDYLYNPDFWELEWSWRSVGRKSLLLPLLAVLVTGNYKSKVHLRIICFTVFSLVMEHLSTDHDLKNLFHPKTNSPWYHLLSPVLFLLLTRFFSDYLDQRKYRLLAWGLPLAFTVLGIANAWVGDGFYSFPSKIIGLYSLMGILLSSGYFLYLLRSLKDYYIERQPMFWVSSGLLVYFSGNFLLWIGLNFITYDRGFFDSIYRINSVVTILLYLFFTIAICLNPQSENKTPTT